MRLCIHGHRVVHLKLVSTLLTEDFPVTLPRFMPRMGQCSNLYRDNCLKLVDTNYMLTTYFTQSTGDHTPANLTGITNRYFER